MLYVILKHPSRLFSRTAASPENPKALQHFDSKSFSFSITCKFLHMPCVHRTKCSVDSLSELTDEPLCDVQTWKKEQKKNYIKNIIFVILDLSCSGGRRSTQIIKPTPKNENSIIFLLTSMWIGSCTTPTITYMFWCLNDSCSPKVLDSVQQIASDGCNSSKSFRASLTVEVPST